MQQSIRLFLFLGAISCSFFSATAQQADLRFEQKRELKVLTIGNSFSQSLYRYFPEVARSAGCSLVLENLNIGGCSLHGHWGNISREESEPGWKFFKTYSYREKLESKDWDVVSIQQASHASWNYDTYQPFAKNIVEYVRKYAPNAEIVIQQTWAYRPDDGRLEAWQMTQEEMYEKLVVSYARLALSLIHI